MPNRFADTDIWKKQKWFKRLSPLYKLTWRYLTDVCDHAGIWKIDLPELLDDISIDFFDLNDFVESCNQDYDKITGKKIQRNRLVMLNGDTLWITGFIAFQYGKNLQVTEAFGAARSAIRQIQDMGLYQQAVENKYFIHVIPEKYKDSKGQSETVPDPPEQSGTPPDSKGKGNSIGKGNTNKESSSNRELGDTEVSKGEAENKFLGIKLNSMSLESVEMNQYDLTGKKNTEWIKSQWEIFLKERNNDSEIKQKQYLKNHNELNSHFINWIRPKKPPINGTHKSPINGNNQQQGSRSDYKTDQLTNNFGLANKAGNNAGKEGFSSGGVGARPNV